MAQTWKQVRLNIGVNDINQMGAKVNVADLNVSQGTIEKDFDVLNGISVDMKHSISNTPGIDLSQLKAVEAAIKNGRIPGAWYAGAGQFSSGDISNVAAANARIKAALGFPPDAPDFIRLFNTGAY